MVFQSRTNCDMSNKADILVVMISEFNTSQKCQHCHHQLSDEFKGKNLDWSVRCCINSKCRIGKHYKNDNSSSHSNSYPYHKCFWNRDVNASGNILDLLELDLQNKPRPEEFCSSKKNLNQQTRSK